MQHLFVAVKTDTVVQCMVCRIGSTNSAVNARKYETFAKSGTPRLFMFRGYQDLRS